MPRRERVVRGRRLVGHLPDRGADRRRRDVAVEQRACRSLKPSSPMSLLVVEPRPACSPAQDVGAGCAAWAGCFRLPGSAPWAKASPSSASVERTLVYHYCNSGVRSQSCQGRPSRPSSTASSTTPRSSHRGWRPSTSPCASTSTGARGRMPSTSARCSSPPPRRVSLATLAAADPRTAQEPLEVSLVVRPGSPAQPSSTPSPRCGTTTGCSSRQPSLGWADGWRQVLDAEVPVVVEVGLGDDQARGLDDIAAAVDDEHDVTAKFRTGPTPAWPWPDEAALGGFLDAVVLHGLPFKATGGLHHAVRGTHGGEPMHGLLNVLLATHEALGGAEAHEPVRRPGPPRHGGARHRTLEPVHRGRRAGPRRTSRPSAAAVCSTRSPSSRRSG